MKRIAIALGVALAFSTSPALAAAAEGGTSMVSLETAATELAPNDWVWSDQPATGPMNIVVSIPDQRAYVYEGGKLVAVSTVSTGKDGKDTPLGTYAILQKQVSHHSNLYNSAPMPYMQRLTWDGIALHAGNNPGYAASHGCVRLPMAFAKKLYGATSTGTIVNVTDQTMAEIDPATLPTVPTYDAGGPSPEAGQTADANAAMLKTISSW